MNKYFHAETTFLPKHRSPMAYMEALISQQSQIRKITPKPIITSNNARAMKAFRHISKRDASRNGFLPCDVTLTQYGLSIVDNEHVGCHYTLEEGQLIITIYWNDYSISTSRANIPENFSSSAHDIALLNDDTLVISCSRKLFKLLLRL